jgi:hypothetical protein
MKIEKLFEDGEYGELTVKQSIRDKFENGEEVKGAEAVALLAQWFGGGTKGGENGYSLMKNVAIEHVANVVIQKKPKKAKKQ